MNNKVWKENQGIVAQYAQAMRVIREKVGEDCERNLDKTGRIDAKTLGDLVDVVTRHHEILLELKDPEFFTRVRSESLKHKYTAITPVGRFDFIFDLSADAVKARNSFY